MIRAELAQAETLFEHLQVQNRQPRHVGRLVSHDAGMLEVTGFRRPIGSGARVLASDGSVCRAEVVGFRGERTLLVPLDADAPLENGIRVEPDSQANMVQVGEGLIGRVIDAMGQPLDRKGPIIAAIGQFTADIFAADTAHGDAGLHRLANAASGVIRLRRRIAGHGHHWQGLGICCAVAGAGLRRFVEADPPVCGCRRGDIGRGSGAIIVARPRYRLLRPCPRDYRGCDSEQQQAGIEGQEAHGNSKTKGSLRTYTRISKF